MCEGYVCQVVFDVGDACTGFVCGQENVDALEFSTNGALDSLHPAFALADLIGFVASIDPADFNLYVGLHIPSQLVGAFDIVGRFDPTGGLWRC